MGKFKNFEEWTSESYDTICVDKIPFYHDNKFIFSSFLGFMKGDEVFICSKEKINHKYDKAEDFTVSSLKQNIIKDIFTYTKKHVIKDIKLVFEYDKEVKKHVSGAEVTFDDLEETFFITEKNQLYKNKVEAVNLFQDDVVTKLTTITEYYKSLKKRSEGSSYTAGVRDLVPTPGFRNTGRLNIPPPTPPSPPPPRRLGDSDIQNFGHVWDMNDYKDKKKKKKKNMIELEVDGVEIISFNANSILNWIEGFFNFMTTLFSFDFSTTNIIIPKKNNLKILQKFVTKEETTDEFYDKLKEHEEDGRTVDEFLEKEFRKEKIKSLFKD